MRQWLIVLILATAVCGSARADDFTAATPPLNTQLTQGLRKARRLRIAGIVLLSIGAAAATATVVGIGLLSRGCAPSQDIDNPSCMTIPGLATTLGSLPFALGGLGAGAPLFMSGRDAVDDLSKGNLVAISF